MADNIEHQDKGELVANCDQLQNDEVVVTTPVESRIMSIRGKQIMIDRDLAELYGVETKVLNQAVKRNMERFPERFRFQLTKEECLRSQIATLNEGRGQHLKYMHFGADIVTRLSTGKILENTSMQPLKSVMI